MNRKAKMLSLIIAAMFTASTLAGCSSKAVEAANQIESRIQERQAKANSFNNIDAADIDEQNAMNIIKELASERYIGRKTGTKENEAALNYITHQYRSIGLRNPDGLENYMQYYSQPLTLLKDTPKLSLLDQDDKIIKEYAYPKNFTFRVLSDSTEDIRINAPMRVVEKASELSGQSFREQEVLLLSQAAQGNSSFMRIMSEMYDTNASVIVVESDVDSENSQSSELIVSALNNRGWGERYKPVITVDSATYAEFAQAAAEHKNISIECSYKYEKAYKTANVVGYIPGTDEKLKNEYIIIGGHMDHVGSNFNGTYNPGALDNASGTAAMIEIARIIAENDIKPKKTLVFIAFNGEEHGLLGAQYYAENPVFPLRNAVMINLDMVGSSATIPLAIAASNSFDLRSEFLELAKAADVEAEESTLAASDHFYFEQKEVPAIMLENIDRANGYHSPYDTLEDVDGKRLKEVIKLVLLYIDKKAY